MNSKTCGRGCSQNWDVRCCCELNCPAKNSLLQFHNCPMRLNTTYFCIGNDREIYKLAENNNWKPIKRIFGMNKKELKQIKNGGTKTTKVPPMKNLMRNKFSFIK